MARQTLLKPKSKLTGILDAEFKRSDFSEKTGKNVAKIWEHFWKRKDGQRALCKICYELEPRKIKLVATLDSNTTGMRKHLETSHSISMKQPKSGTDSLADNGTANGSSSTESQPTSTNPSLQQKEITEFFLRVEEDSMESCIAELAAKDGISFRALAESRVVRKLFRKAGYGELPKCHKTIRENVMRHCEKVRTATIGKIRAALKIGEAFSLTLDEWTAKNNKRYLNVNLHDRSHVCINLGLVPVGETLDARSCVELVKQRIAEFGLQLDKHVVACTTDGASVMKKYGRIAETVSQLCQAHAIQLAVQDVFYIEKKTKAPAEGSDENEDDDAETADEAAEETICTETAKESAGRHMDINSVLQGLEDSDDESEPETLPESVSYDYTEGEVKQMIWKVRRVVKMFRKSPQKQLVLQRQVQNDKEEIDTIRVQKLTGSLKLILDTRTRWSSLYDMLKRFQELQSSVEKALIDLRNRKKLSKAQKKNVQALTDDEKEMQNDIVLSLGPVRDAVEVICAGNVNLLSFEGIIDVLLRNLPSSAPGLGGKLRERLSVRINERRTIWSKLLYTLHNGYPHTLVESESESDEDGQEFQDRMLISPNTLVSKSIILLSRLLDTTDYVDSDEDVSERQVKKRKASNEIPQRVPHESLSLKDQMIIAKKASTKHRPKEIYRPSGGNTLKGHLADEILIFQKSGRNAERGYHLQLVYDYLLTIRPTSVASERAFSLAGQFASKLRPQLGDAVLDKLTFLKSFFNSN